VACPAGGGLLHIAPLVQALAAVYDLIMRNKSSTDTENPHAFY
jgi:hypothetical protein